MNRKIVILCVTVLLMLTCSFTALAEGFDRSKTGSVSVTLTDADTPVVGAELSVYHVATVTLGANGNLNYVYTNSFEHSGMNMDDPSLAAKIDAYVSKHNITSIKITTDNKGTALCKELPLGLYFVKQAGVVEGFAPCTPFLVTIPGEKNGDYVYEVNASPKTEVEKLTSITIKKVWNTDASTEATDSVTVQLLKNGTVVKTATLNTQNDWQVTYADMPESDAYSVKEVDVPKGFTATYKQNGYTFTVTNTATLIQTGQVMWPIPVLAVSGMLLIAAGIALLQKKREANA